MHAGDIFSYYSRPDIQEALVAFAKNREAVGVFRTGSFAQRPSTLVYAQDVNTQTRQGVIEFHASVEHWNNPIALDKRIGFDLILDLDCKHFMHGKIAAIELVRTLEQKGVHPSIKFSGNRGFHIGVPWSSLPKDVDFRPTQELFPDIARKVCQYLRSMVQESLEKALLKYANPETLAEQAEKPLKDILTETSINPFAIADIDSVLLSPRHLYRMPYSLNKKAFLVSLPLTIEQLPTFEREHAHPQKVRVKTRFLDAGKPGEADRLFLEALDWWAREHVPEPAPTKKPELKGRVPVEQFPPCVKAILNGMGDGKKRSLFVVVNFLRSCKWTPEEILPFVKEWNQKNTPPLPESLLTTHVRYTEKREAFLPPNCTQEGYYLAMGVCKPDHICKSREDLKNPVKYPLRLQWREEWKASQQKGKKKSSPRKPKEAIKPEQGKPTPSADDEAL